MGKWEPESLHKDPMVNAILNVAMSLSELAEATNGLLYGLKYGKQEGLSIAEALEASGKDITNSLGNIVDAISSRDTD